MDLSVDRTASGREYKVNDISQTGLWTELALAKMEMRSLETVRTKYGPNHPLKGAKITVSIDVTTPARVLIKTLNNLGAEVRVCSRGTHSTNDYAAAAIIAGDCASVFAWNGQTPREYVWCMERALDWGQRGGPDLIIDDGGDITRLICEGIKAEKMYEKTGQLPDLSSRGTEDPKLQVMLTNIRDGLKSDSQRFHRMKERLVGVSGMTTHGIQMLWKMQADGTFLEAIGINDSPIKRMWDNWYGTRLSLVEGLRRAFTGDSIAEKAAVVCGYGEVGKGCADALKEARAKVFVTENSPDYAFDALVDGFPVKPIDDFISMADFVVTTTDYKDGITVEHMRKMKNNAVICSIGQFDNDIDMEELETYPGVRRITINPQTDKWYFPETNTGVIVLAEGRMMNLGCATGHPSFVESCPYTDHVIGLLELWKLKDGRTDA
ncbi:Adenosylhomocysteinase [Parasponia andersonii]|uniref:Adenosylhomocysteinase n=1 Tax=Parasponia andersonii TaxID=3476 RepID=A0A2P5C3P8_PARAD|nr:Adenosylhomocysteinase [Parasponia andersonii]